MSSGSFLSSRWPVIYVYQIGHVFKSELGWWQSKPLYLINIILKIFSPQKSIISFKVYKKDSINLQQTVET